MGVSPEGESSSCMLCDCVTLSMRIGEFLAGRLCSNVKCVCGGVKSMMERRPMFS